MAIPGSFLEEKRLNIYWKIKNFNFCCETIESPEFSISGIRYRLWLNPATDSIFCCPIKSGSTWQADLWSEISFLTCDGKYPARGVRYLKVPKEEIFKIRRNSLLPKDTLTVRFRYLDESDREHIFMYSEIGVKRINFLLTYKLLANSQCRLEKSIETSESYGDIKLTLKCTEGFNSDERLFIEISRKGGEKCYFVLKLFVLGVKGKYLNEINDEFVLEKKDDLQTRAFPALFKKSMLLASKNQLQSNDALSLRCNLAMSLGSLADQTSVVSYIGDVGPLKESDDLLKTVKENNDNGSLAELQTDLKTILNDGTLFDGTLQVDSEVIKVHKAILGARSPVFKAMFTKDMKETINNTVVIEDLDVETVCRLLLYIYTGSIRDEQWEDIKKLYFASDKYEVLSLKKKCRSFLKTNLTVSNVCESVILADLHQDEDLKTAALEFIAENDCAVFNSEEWKELEKNNSSLGFQVMHEVYCSKRFR